LITETLFLVSKKTDYGEKDELFWCLQELLNICSNTLFWFHLEDYSFTAMSEEASHSEKNLSGKVTSCCSPVWCNLVLFQKEDVSKNRNITKAIIQKK
jgi:hypothetical protein